MRKLLGLDRRVRRRATSVLLVLTVVGVGLAEPEARAADPVLVGAGDVASCTQSGDSVTAKLAAATGASVFTLGDNAYESGTVTEFATCYSPTWGVFKGRTHPALGNHEYGTKAASGYFSYFGSAAGPRGKGWYSYDLGAWHVVVLNSNCGDVGCAKGSEQERWLRADLAAHGNKCTLAYWHHARFSSDHEHGDDPSVGPFWDALYQYGADLVLSAHAHDYERFAPQTPAGKANSAFGIREIIAGTGGDSHYSLGSARPNSQVRNSTTFGVVKLTLHSGSYDWRFLPQPGQSFSDSGSANCHGRPGP